MTADDDLFAEEENEGPLFEEESTDIVELLTHWSPALLFALSLIYMSITVMMNPWQERKLSREAIEYYERAYKNASQVRAPGASFDESTRRRMLTISLVNLSRLLFHYGGNLDEPGTLIEPVQAKGDLRYVNPFLVLAETYRLLEPVTIQERREEFLGEARELYTRALQFERRRRSEEDVKRWNEQFVLTGGDELPQEARVRQERRERYIRYFRAVTNLRLGRVQLAMSELRDLGKLFFREEMNALRQEKDGNVGMTLEEEVPLADYELLDEDKVKLHYFLGQLYMLSGEVVEAEKEYRLFLLQAPRSREAFQARMRLGSIQYERGLELRKGAQKLLGQEKHAQLEKVQQHFQSAGDAFSRVVNASPQEDLLREAYFLGGMCKLAYGETMDVGRETWWDFSAREGRNLQHLLERFSGASLPPRTLALPDALGRAMLSDAGGTAGSYSGVAPALLGSGLVLAMKERVTPKDERRLLLRQARSFFDAAASDLPGGHSEGECRVMIGRSLLAEGRLLEARRIFAHALSSYSDNQVLAGASFGTGQTHQNMGELEEAWRHYRKLPHGEALVSSALLNEYEIVQALRRLGQSYIVRADRARFPAAWGRASPGSPNWLSAVQQAENQREALARATQVFERMINRYSLEGHDVSLRVASLYARRARLLKTPPLGSKRDQVESRRLFFAAADQYWSAAARAPGSSFSASALEKAGELFFSLGAYQRAIESLRLFEERHERSQRVAMMRNRLGQAYQRLAMYKEAVSVFRSNAEDTNVPEGRKSLVNLGTAYREWGPKYWGGPTLPEELLDEEERKARPPQDPDYSVLHVRDIIDWQGVMQRFREARAATGHTPVRRLLEMMGEGFSLRLQELDLQSGITPEVQAYVVESLNRLLTKPGLYDATSWRGAQQNEEVDALLRWGRDKLKPRQLTRLNRLLLQSAFPNEVARSFGGRSQSTIPGNAMEIFEYIRRLPGHGPESIPWRNSTFALGYTLYDIADHLRAVLKRNSNLTKEQRNWYQENSVEQYHRAATVLREGLARYRLYPEFDRGYRREREPEVYTNVIRHRFRASYFLAKSLRQLGHRGEAIPLFRALLDEGMYPEELVLFEGNEPDALLQHYKRNAYMYLGLLLFEDKQYEHAYLTFETANDRLDPVDSPYLLYRMGECLRAMGKFNEAKTRFIQAHHLAKNAPTSVTGTFDEFGMKFWSQANDQRLKDLEYLERMAALEEQ
ncbi:MAG: tetratricopeptide repeat protein [Planctomycetota bacterium]|jgi:tetratricopeptide (TPR) repeat protein